MARRARRGEGTVYFSKSDRRWVARYPLGVIGGRSQSKRVKCSTERAARVELEQLRRIYQAGATPAGGTLDAYLAVWLVSHRDIRESTRRSYRDHIANHIAPLLGGLPVSRLRPSDVDRLIADRLGAGLSGSTVRSIVTTLHIALSQGVKRGELGVNVAGQVRLPRVEREPVAAMSARDADSILATVSGHWLEPVVRLLLGSGLRLGEAVSLNQGDVHDGFVRLRTSKTRLRAVTVSEDALDALREAIRDAPRVGPKEPVFFGPRTGDRLTVATVSHAFPRVLQSRGLPRMRVHDLRHGVASIMVASGVHIRTVAEQLGHANPQQTLRTYAHILPDTLRAAVESLPKGKRA